MSVHYTRQNTVNEFCNSERTGFIILALRSYKERGFEAHVALLKWPQGEKRSNRDRTSDNSDQAGRITSTDPWFWEGITQKHHILKIKTDYSKLTKTGIKQT